ADPAVAEAGRGTLRVACQADSGGRHALVYTSYQQLVAAHEIAPDQHQHQHHLSWSEVPAAALFECWPADVDVWLNAGGQVQCQLDHDDIRAVAGIAAGHQVDEAYEVGPEDRFTDLSGPTLPDRTDCAVVVALLDTPEVVEVFRVFRRLDEPQGRTWRILLVLTDGDTHTENLAQTVVRAVNAASDECCEVHVANVRDDGVYDAVAPIVRIGVPLWRRDGFCVPDTLDGFDRLNVEPDEPPGWLS
ncbi:MAG TPA: hypothetical protein VIS06_06075, partial [Mycobacteriales bacterium]